MSVTLDTDDDVIPGLLPDGRPDPAYAASLGIVAAGRGRRATAFVIDAAIYVVLLLPLLVGALPMMLGIVEANPDPTRWVSQSDFLLVLILWLVGQGAVTIFTIVQLALHGVRGVTVGKAILGIRSVNVATFGKPGFWRVVLRALVLSTAFTLVPYLGAIPFLLSPLWDPEQRGRGWLDRLGNNWLIDTRRGLDPANVKALRHARRALGAPVSTGVEALPSLATGTAWAGPTFVPAARSSSGVVSASRADSPAPAWEPPTIAPMSGTSDYALLSAAPTTAAPLPPLSASRRTAPPPAPLPTAAPAPAASPAQVRSVTLAFNDGLRFDVDGDVLLGRNPEMGAKGTPARLLRIDDPAKQLSKTHLAIGIDPAGVWISDQGSSNGTYVTDSVGRTDALTAFVKTYIAPGTVVAMGDRTFVVTPKDAQ